MITKSSRIDCKKTFSLLIKSKIWLVAFYVLKSWFQILRHHTCGRRHTAIFYLSLFHQMLFSSQRPYQGEVRDTLRCLENIYQAFFEVPSIPRVDLSLSLKNIFFKNIIYIILILLNNNYYSMYIHSVHTFMINEIYL